jgi:ATP-dependent DNA helicase RecQ
VVLSDENIDGIIEAGSCSWILSKDIETYGIKKLLKRDWILSRIKNFMMSEDHEYNESEDEAIVTAAKAGGTADVLMGMLRDLRKSS